MHNKVFYAQNIDMSKRKNKKLTNEFFSECASANECTGMLQKILLDPDEVAEFHRMYNEIADENKK